MRKFFIKLSPIFFLLLLGQGCIKIQTGSGGADGGIYKSLDRGMTWLQKTLVLSSPVRPLSISGLNVNKLVIDPSDPATLYIATVGSGVFYSLDGGEGWLQSRGLPGGTIYDIAVDSRNKCTLYSATANKLLKSTDCARTWNSVFVDTRPEVLVTRVLLDKSNPNVIYLGSSSSLSGDLAKSMDGGVTWKPIYHWDSPIFKIVQDAFDPQLIYVATQNNGLSRSADAGASFEILTSSLDKYPGTRDFSDLMVDPNKTQVVYYVSIFGILRSLNAGTTWEKLDLLTPPGSTRIHSIGINPQNVNELFYATASTFYKSKDGGRQWETKKLPTSRAARGIVIDPTNPNVMYLVTYKLD